ncbi:hypothetical protein HY632_03980 [Candidatus Uhrbacteria bacterium]|nr:hypothetical protein [Candidatus Uhrbacteria bacterium]
MLNTLTPIRDQCNCLIGPFPTLAQEIRMNNAAQYTDPSSALPWWFGASPDAATHAQDQLQLFEQMCPDRMILEGIEHFIRETYHHVQELAQLGRGKLLEKLRSFEHDRAQERAEARVLERLLEKAMRRVAHAPITSDPQPESSDPHPEEDAERATFIHSEAVIARQVIVREWIQFLLEEQRRSPYPMSLSDRLVPYRSVDVAPEDVDAGASPSVQEDSTAFDELIRRMQPRIALMRAHLVPIFGAFAAEVAIRVRTAPAHRATVFASDTAHLTIKQHGQFLAMLPGPDPGVMQAEMTIVATARQLVELLPRCASEAIERQLETMPPRERIPLQELFVSAVDGVSHAMRALTHAIAAIEQNNANVPAAAPTDDATLPE